MDLAELHRLRLVDVAGGPQDKEKRVPVALQLRALMGVDRVLDRELVEIELTRHSRELILSRLVKAEPHDPAAVAARSREIGEPDRLADPPAIAVDRGIHDHVEQATPSAVRLDPGCHFAPRATRRSAAPPNCPRWFRPALRPRRGDRRRPWRRSLHAARPLPPLAAIRRRASFMPPHRVRTGQSRRRSHLRGGRKIALPQRVQWSKSDLREGCEDEEDHHARTDAACARGRHWPGRASARHDRRPRDHVRPRPGQPVGLL
jgi:hypothetical protein